MATKIKFKRGTTSQISAITPESGEPVWDTDLLQLFIGDGVTPGGRNVGSLRQNGTSLVGFDFTQDAATRGTKSLDLISGRSGATKIVAGSYTLSIGYDNRTTGRSCIQAGEGNTQSGNYNTQFGKGCTQSGFWNFQVGKSHIEQSGICSSQSGYSNTQSGNYCSQSGYDCTQNGNIGFQHGDGLNDGTYGGCFMAGGTKTATVSNRAYFNFANGIWLNPIATASAPSSPEEGVIYFDSTLHKLRIRSNVGWETVTSA